MKAQKENASNLFGREGSREVRDKAGVWYRGKGFPCHAAAIWVDFYGQMETTESDWLEEWQDQVCVLKKNHPLSPSN